MSIKHCGKNLKTEFEYTLLDYPHRGSNTFLKSAVCPECHNNTYQYQVEYNYSAKELTGWEQAPNYKRIELDEVIRVGTCQIIQKDVRETDDKQEKPEPIVGQYTRLVKRPADTVIPYHNRLDDAIRRYG